VPRPTYKHVVSIGYFCSTALELERYGFREASYPLDWVTCPLKPTLALLESDFQGFVRPESLARDSVHNYIVHDAQSGIDFYHDFNSHQTIEEQVVMVQEKYRRRISRWRAAITERALFVRYIANSDELDYLDENMPAVLLLLRRSNPLNDLLLVGNSDLRPTCGGLKVFRVDADEGDVVARAFVEKNRLLQLKLLTLPYPLALRVRNYLRYTRSLHGQERRRVLRKRLLIAPWRLASSLLGEDRLRRLVARVRDTKSE